MTEYVCRARPDLHVVLMADFDPEAGVYLSTTPRPAGELRRLCRSSRRASQWQGVVYCERLHPGNHVAEELLQEWQPGCMQLGPLLFFGDPDLLAQLRNVLRDLHG